MLQELCVHLLLILQHAQHRLHIFEFPPYSRRFDLHSDICTFVLNVMQRLVLHTFLQICLLQWCSKSAPQTNHASSACWPCQVQSAFDFLS